MATKRKRKQRGRKPQARNSDPPGFWLFFLTRLLAGGIFAASLVFIYLDYEIRQRFEGNIQSEPAHVYARPVEIYPGAKLDGDQIEKSLQKHGYSQVEQISEPGQYARAGNLLFKAGSHRRVFGARSQRASSPAKCRISEISCGLALRTVLADSLER